MFICQYCEKQLIRREGKTLHEKHCKENPNRIKRTGAGSFKVGNSGKSSNPEKEKERVRKITEHAKLKNGGYRRGSGRGIKGWYKGIFCDSSWELAFVLYHIEHNIQIQKSKEVRFYEWKGNTKKYYPDFIVESRTIEIKGYKTKQWEAKLRDNPDVLVYYEKDIKHMIDYAISKYGKNFTDLLYETKEDAEVGSSNGLENRGDT